MRAALTRRYGPPDAVELADWPDPVAGPGTVLVRVTAAPVTRADARIRALDMPAGFSVLARLAFGLRRPRQPVQGMEFAGVVETGTALLPAGTRVMGITGLAGGAHAERLAIRADGLILPTPDSLTDTEAAAFFFGGLTAARFLIDAAGIGPGHRLLVDGATGAVGSAAIQIARHLGAHVTARTEADRAERARGLGAHAVTDRGAPLPAGPFDAILDVAGRLGLARAAPALAPGGCLLMVTGSLGQTLGAALRPRRGGRRVIGGTVRETRAAMERLLALHAAGGYRPLVGRSLPFEAIAEAHAVAGSGSKTGSVVVRMPSAA